MYPGQAGIVPHSSTAGPCTPVGSVVKRGSKCIDMTKPETANSPLDLPLTFSYRLDGPGWAEADLTCGDQSLHLTASYLSNALDNLLEAVEQLLDGAETTDAFWDEEPGRFHWDFRRHGSMIDLQVLIEDGTRRGGSLPSWRIPAGAPPRGTGLRREFAAFSFSAELSVVAGAIATGAGDLLSEEGELAYWERWRAARFPTQVLWRIQDKLGLNRTELPDPAPGDPDPARLPVRSLWQDFLSGDLSAKDTLIAIEERRLSSLCKTPVVRAAIRSLRDDAASVRWTSNAYARSAAHYEYWLAGLELYDRAPLEWARQFWMARLAHLIEGHTADEARATADNLRGLLDEADLDRVLRDRPGSRD